MDIAALQKLFRRLPIQAQTQGETYCRQGHVLECHFDAERHELSALVQGSERTPYEVLMSFDAKGLPRNQECNCLDGNECKHIAAVVANLLQKALDEQSSGGRNPVLEWLSSIEASLKKQAPRVEASINRQQRVVYLVQHQAGTAQLMVSCMQAQRLKSGAWSKPRALPLSSLQTHAHPEWFDDEDFAIAQLLVRQPGSRAGFELDEIWAPMILGKLCLCGRAYWQTDTGPILKPGITRYAEPLWLTLANGDRQMRLETTPPGLLIIPLQPVFYVDQSSGDCGELICELPHQLIYPLLRTPIFRARDISHALPQLRKILGAAALPLPDTIPVQKVKAQPKPRLWLRSLISSEQKQVWRRANALDVGSLSFLYSDHDIAAWPNQELTRITRQGQMYEIHRNTTKEKEFTDQILALLQSAESVYGPQPELLRPSDFSADGEKAWISFLVHHVPILRENGWDIVIHDDFRYTLRTPDDWYGEIDDDTPDDWFDMELGVMVDGEKINLLPLLLEAIDELPAFLASSEQEQQVAVLVLRSAGGKQIAVPFLRVAPALNALNELFDRPQLTADGKLRLSRLHALRLNEFSDLRWQGGKRTRELAVKLHDFAGLELALPAPGFGAQLRLYQQTGLAWLQFLREYEFGGILADDMGLGKTVQALAHLHKEKAEGRLTSPALVIAPTSLMYNWKAETQRFASDFRVLVLHGPQRAQLFESIGDHDLVLTTYPLVSRDHDKLKPRMWSWLILDEAQNIKNSKSQTTSLIHELKSRHRLCLTGTPMENHLGELWSLFHFLMPGFLGSENQFRQTFRIPIEKEANAPRARQLAQRVAPFLLRRTKETVATELPPKTEMIRIAELGTAQRDLYETIRLSMHQKVRDEIARKGLARSQIIVLDALLKLRQICCDPRLADLPSAKKVKDSAKLNLLMELLPEMIEEGRRILLFSQFTSMLALIEEQLIENGIAYAKLTGQTRDRETPIKRFQQGETPVFLISLKAGGVGLNLTAADTVIHYDPWWNPAVEDQATDRAYRIGQDKPVFVYRLVCAGTVEEKMADLKARKKALANGVYGDQDAEQFVLDNDTIEALLQPIT